MEEDTVLQMDLGTAYNYLRILSIETPKLTENLVVAKNGLTHHFDIGYFTEPSLMKYVYVSGRNISIRKEYNMKPEDYYEEKQQRLAYLKKIILDQLEEKEDITPR